MLEITGTCGFFMSSSKKPKKQQKTAKSFSIATPVATRFHPQKHKFSQVFSLPLEQISRGIFQVKKGPHLFQDEGHGGKE